MIAIARSRPEEAVLTTCKRPSGNENPSGAFLGCQTPLGPGCNLCTTTGSS